MWVNNRVDCSLILDFHHSCGEFKGRNSLLEVLTRTHDVCNHYCFAVATQGILEQSGQFGVSVWDMPMLSFHEGTNDISQGRQRKVDLGCFF